MELENPFHLTGEGKYFTYMVLICFLMVIFITMMDIFGAKMFLALGEARHVTYATIETQYLQFFWLFTIAMVSFSSITYFIMRRRIAETIAVFIAQILFVLSGLEDILFYLFQGKRLAAVSLTHLYDAPAGIVTKILFLDAVTPLSLIANALLFTGVGILILNILRQEGESVTIKKMADVIVAVVVIIFFLTVFPLVFGVDLTSSLNDKVAPLKTEILGCAGVSLNVETFGAEYLEEEDLVHGKIYMTNNGDVNLRTAYFFIEFYRGDGVSELNVFESPIVFRDPDSWDEVGLIKPRQRVFMEFKADPEEFAKAYRMKITPSVDDPNTPACYDDAYWISKTEWETVNL